MSSVGYQQFASLTVVNILAHNFKSCLLSVGAGISALQVFCANNNKDINMTIIIQCTSCWWSIQCQYIA